MASRRVIPERWIIYLLENIKNGKYYIGMTKQTLNKRWKGHVSDATNPRKQRKKNTLLGAAIREYGRDSFERSVLYIADTGKEAAEIEKCFIAELNLQGPNGYNMTRGGQGMSPKPPMSEESQAKRRAKLLGRALSPEHRAAIGKAHRERGTKPPRPNLRGRKRKPETLLKISIARKGKKLRPHNLETRIKIGKGNSFGGHLLGTWYDPKKQKWLAVIMIDRRRIHIGYFGTAEEAHAAYMTVYEVHQSARQLNRKTGV